MTGPLATYGQGSIGTQDPAASVAQIIRPVAVASRADEACDHDAAYDPDRPCALTSTLAAATPAWRTTAPGCDPVTAYDPSRVCTDTGPSASLEFPVGAVSQSSLYQPAAPVASTTAPSASTPRAGTSATATASGGVWAIQVGAFSDPVLARAVATGVHNALANLLTTAQIELLPTSLFGGKVAYRARLSNLTADTASAACARLAADQQPCMVVAPAQAL